MKDHKTNLPLGEVEFDDENPRIRGALEKYGDKINAERIYFALKSSGDDGGQSFSGFHRLKISVKANEGIAEAIKVVKSDGRYVCIDGNTRLAIYRDFNKDEPDGIWATIPAIVLEDASKIDIEKVRITAHLVGSRPWPAYEKAQHLRKMRYEKLMDYSEIVALCGGNKGDIDIQINAFDDMNEYYKNRVEDGDFKIDRFSGFVELQKSNIKDSIYDAGYSLNDFGDWISNGNIYALADVRLLPKVLKDEDATKKFVEGGIHSIREAARIVDEKCRPKNGDDLPLQDADLVALAYAFRARIEAMTMLDFEERREDETFLSMIESLSQRLTNVLEYVRK